MIFAALSFLAQPAPAAPGSQSMLGGLAIPVMMVFMFYFMLIRPQQRQAKEHRARLAALKSGDEVIAAGGIHGLVTNLTDRTVMLKIADGVKIKIEKASIVTVLTKEETAATEVVSS
jgi:preprotein translocase subunit YajC